MSQLSEKAQLIDDVQQHDTSLHKCVREHQGKQKSSTARASGPINYLKVAWRAPHTLCLNILLAAPAIRASSTVAEPRGVASTAWLGLGLGFVRVRVS